MQKLTFQLTSPYIQLNQLLKVMDIGDTGGQAKHFIIQGLVKVNGSLEERIRRKLIANDVVQYKDIEITVLDMK